VAFVILFTIGGLSGLMLGIVPADIQYHDTYFVVAHFHYVLVSGALFSIIAGVYYWLPKWCGRMYSEKLATIHFWWAVLSVNVLFFPMHFLGLAGMPRRIPDYSLQFADFNLIASVGGFLFGLSFLLLAYIIVDCIRNGRVVEEPRVWESAKGLEWTLPTPAPYHTFNEEPSRELILKESSHTGH
jgi:cytochrome c oxidase subunit 1